MPCRTSQAHDSSEVRTSGRRKRDLRRSMILKDHDVKIGKINHWTVSTTVLRWLQAKHKKQQVFVGNRIAEIPESSSIDHWRNVKSTETSEDIGTRGISIERINETDWLNEPAWLQTNEECWPKPWCQEKEVEPEQTITAVETENPSNLFTGNATANSTESKTLLPTARGSRRSRGDLSKQTRFTKQSKYCFNLFKPEASRTLQNR